MPAYDVYISFTVKYEERYRIEAESEEAVRDMTADDVILDGEALSTQENFRCIDNDIIEVKETESGLAVVEGAG